MNEIQRSSPQEEEGTLEASDVHISPQEEEEVNQEASAAIFLAPLVEVRQDSQMIMSVVIRNVLHFSPLAEVMQGSRVVVMMSETSFHIRNAEKWFFTSKIVYTINANCMTLKTTSANYRTVWIHNQRCTTSRELENTKAFHKKNVVGGV
ncbi:hypothetical protein PUN28_017792 [Cardiocondyla obscurior]|uniref:Uncharacterized protein n=1 Tax=Cardiocondyla obscurior TaxID=286306 RepID=A0AAW2ENX0_9HYME